jgi:hypothetical protein
MTDHDPAALGWMVGLPPAAKKMDFVRFGELIGNRGRLGDKHVLPPEVVGSILKCGDREVFARGGCDTLAGWS